VDASAKCHTTADVHATADKVVNSDVTPAAAALDNGSVVCQTTN